MWIDDEVLARCAEPLALACWVPKQQLIVLGSSNTANSEVAESLAVSDQVPILKRYGGGGTVLLHPGCVVVSIGAWVADAFRNQHYFEKINKAVIASLASRWAACSDLSQRGLSDLAAGSHKVAGTSLFRSRNYLLYQASILVDLRIAAIERYLPHPSKEPEYREGRKHTDFLKGLSDLDSSIDAETCAQVLKSSLEDQLNLHLRGDLVQPKPEQFVGLLRRAGL